MTEFDKLLAAFVKGASAATAMKSQIRGCPVEGVDLNQARATLAEAMRDVVDIAIRAQSQQIIS